MNMSELLEALVTGEWIPIQLYRRHYFNPLLGIWKTYTMGVKQRGQDGTDFIAYFAHVCGGKITETPDFKLGEVDVQTMKITYGVLRTYGYLPGRYVWYNQQTHEFKEFTKVGQ